MQGIIVIFKRKNVLSWQVFVPNLMLFDTFHHLANQDDQVERLYEKVEA